jgi:hypothetical protein
MRSRICKLQFHLFIESTNYISFAPITIMTGVYGMNVSQISGSDSNPNIWQFFVATVVLNVVMLLTLAISNWIHTIFKHGRRPGMKEVLGFAVGNTRTKEI